MLKNALKSWGIWGIVLLLGACSGPYSSSKYRVNAPTKATSRPYQIKGKWYYPQQHYEYNEVGIASWYGPGFHRNPTSTGEIYNQNLLTAAHKTLPLPCIALVTNLENGRMLKLKVNDRGPFVEGRIIDLSKKSAEVLGVLEKGTAKVRVETLVAESIALNALGGGKRVAPAFVQAVSKNVQSQIQTKHTFKAHQKKILPQQQVYVQVGSFLNASNAQRVSKKLAPMGRVVTDRVRAGQKSYYRVKMGPFVSREKANQALKKIVNMGISDAKITI